MSHHDLKYYVVHLSGKRFLFKVHHIFKYTYICTVSLPNQRILCMIFDFGPSFDIFNACLYAYITIVYFLHVRWCKPHPQNR